MKRAVADAVALGVAVIAHSHPPGAATIEAVQFCDAVTAPAA